ncbi:MAG: hypothetical protein ABIP75_12350 [Pyrinomonadaceae bacterium]
MGLQLLEKHFGLMGARVKINQIVLDWYNRAGIDIRRDRHGEFFDIRIAVNDTVTYEVIDLDPGRRHLLLLGRREGVKEKFLCGHDERHWFVCAVPGPGVTNVTRAMEELQPVEVRWQVQHRVRRKKNRLARHNEAFVRQGEWFFVPAAQLPESPKVIFRNEAITRGNGGKPHVCEEVFRFGGEPVMISHRFPLGLTLDQYEQLLKGDRRAQKLTWRPMRRNAAVFARGRVRHSDHQTVMLDGWHRVYMNTEFLAPGARSVVFLD